MPRERKNPHIALRQMTASLIAAKDKSQKGQVLGQPFPLPGNEGLNVGSMPPHTAIVGSTGSGKTIIQKHLMSRVLKAPAELGGLRFRSVVYDPKQELYDFLIRLGIPRSQIIVANPFHQDSASWDLATDFRETAQIDELAEMIVPKSEHASDNRFFEDVSRILVTDVIESLREIQPDDWSLRDVCEVCLRMDNLKPILNKTHNGQASWDTYLAPLESEFGDRTAQSCLASLQTYVRPFQNLAKYWHSAKNCFSLDQWHVGSGLLLLGADTRRERTLQRVNQLLIRRICQLLLARRQENPIDLTWFFIDEVREAGKLNGLRQLMTSGRSKGARVVLGFQDIEGLYSLYGQHEAEEMIGLCSNRVVLHLDNPKTRKWASDFFGEAEEYLPSESSGQSYGKDVSRSSGVHIGLNLRANVLPIEFCDLPLGNPFEGIRGWSAIPGRRQKFFVPPETAKRAVLMQNHTNSDESLNRSRPQPAEGFGSWDDDDFEAFGVRVPKTKKTRKRKKGKRRTENGQQREFWQFDGGEHLVDSDLL